jgi:hypothetical protein
MIPGYNHNVKYKDTVYHVQTEDSGVANPHIITHLFVGGNIIASLKTSYADIVQSPNLSELLVDLMQAQHKTVLKDLIRGRYDSDIAVRSKNASSLNGPAPLNVEAGQHRTSFMMGGAAEAVRSAPKPGTPPPTAKAPPPAAKAPDSGSIFGGAPPPPPPPAASSKVLDAAALEAAFESKDDKAVDSIFGNLISEKSLDEVILSYLADDKPRD